MVKMKRISYAVNPQGIPSEALKRQEDRILRGIDQAVASAEDQEFDAKEKTESVMNSLGKVGGSGDTSKLQDKLNQYIGYCEQAYLANRAVDYLKNLKKALAEEIEVTLNPTPVEIVNK